MENKATKQHYSTPEIDTANLSIENPVMSGYGNESITPGEDD